MKIQFNLDIEDWWAFRYHHLLQHTSLRTQLLIYPFVLPVVGGLLLLFYFIDDYNYLLYYFGEFLVYGLASAVWALFINKFVLAYLKNSHQQPIRQSPYFILGIHEIDISELGLADTIDGKTELLEWKNIRQFIELDDFYFMYKSDNEAIIIPKEKLNLNNAQFQQLDSFIKNALLQYN